MHMLATLTSHYNLVNAEPELVTLSSPELDGISEIYFLTVFQVPLHNSMEELLREIVPLAGSSNCYN